MSGRMSKCKGASAAMVPWPFRLNFWQGGQCPYLGSVPQTLESGGQKTGSQCLHSLMGKFYETKVVERPWFRGTYKDFEVGLYIAEGFFLCSVLGLYMGVWNLQQVLKMYRAKPDTYPFYIQMKFGTILKVSTSIVSLNDNCICLFLLVFCF